MVGASSDCYEGVALQINLLEVTSYQTRRAIVAASRFSSTKEIHLRFNEPGYLSPALIDIQGIKQQR